MSPARRACCAACRVWRRPIGLCSTRSFRVGAKHAPCFDGGRGEIFQAGGRTQLDRYPHLFAALRDSLGHIPEPEVLSFGCSTGEEIVTLRRYLPRARLAGIDINPARLRAARKLVNDPSVRLWEAASLTEADAGLFDAITCLSVLQNNHLRHHWPVDPTPYLTFAAFEQAVIDLDRHLRPGGILLLYHTSFRFVDTDVAQRYTPLLIDEPTNHGLSMRYDRDNKRLMEPISERYALFRKDS